MGKESLDMLADMNEPLALMQELAEIAKGKRGEEWRIVAESAQGAVKALEIENQPKNEEDKTEV